MSKLDDILGAQGIFEMGDYGFVDVEGKRHVGKVVRIRPLVREQIKELMLELIGEDEVVPHGGIVGEPFDVGKAAEGANQRALGRNKLRAELRKKVAEL